MIDFLHIDLGRIDPNRLSLNWKENFDSKGGSNGFVAHRFGLEIKHTIGGKTYLKGSPHKAGNILEGRGKQNYDRFDLERLRQTIQALSFELEVDLLATRLIGFDAQTTFNPMCRVEDIIKGCIRHTKHGKAFTIEALSNGGIQAVVEHQHTRLKLYDKGAHSGTGLNQIRFEKKYRKTAAFSHGVFKDYHFSCKNGSQKEPLVKDLLSPIFLELVRRDLLDTWQKVVFVDPSADLTKLKGKMLKDYRRYTQLSVWEGYALEKGQKYTYHKARFEKLQQKSGAYLFDSFAEMIDQTWRNCIAQNFIVSNRSLNQEVEVKGASTLVKVKERYEAKNLIDFNSSYSKQLEPMEFIK